MTDKISYVYPIHEKISFNAISLNHIKYLREERYRPVSRDDNDQNDIKIQGIEIQDIDWSELGNVALDDSTKVLLHPILYPFGSPKQLSQNSRSFSRLLDSKCKIGGFEVSDFDKMSNLSIEILNKLDLVIVPSNWSKDAYIHSGVKSHIEVLPHGIPDEFLDDSVADTANNEIMNLRKRRENGDILILYFMLHSPYRKGANLVTEVMKRIQSKFKNVYLVFKSPGFLDIECPGVNGIELRNWMDINDTKALYDTCDICICPSRGGGFELNAIESASRGIPSLVPNGGCFLDYIDYVIPINISNREVKLNTWNLVHTGHGFEVDIDNFEEKHTDVINNLEKYKSQFRKRSTDIRNRFSWRNIVDTLERYLGKYEFIG